jgi:hypothetical protein
MLMAVHAPAGGVMLQLVQLMVVVQQMLAVPHAAPVL